ncbi:MAG: HAMP domain-containing protein [Burkholderiaceae bacterium]|nr:MAG: HAMP domain-containing protein [Burkholderiaceae bacterium]
MRLYPKTFSRLLLIVFLLAVLPVAVALLRANQSIHGLAEQSRNAVAQATRATRVNLQMVEQTLKLERVARQFLILTDARLLDDYLTVRSSFKDSTSELALLPLEEKQLEQLNRVIEQEENLYARLAQQPRAQAERIELAEGYTALSATANGLLELSRALAEKEVGKLTEQSQQLEQNLLRPLWLLISLGALIAMSALWVVTRPIRALEAAIRTLGSGNLEHKIAVQGPTDLVRLGEQLDWLRKRLRELEEQKARFLRHVSHELKTPLTALREGAALLHDGTVGAITPQQQEIVDILSAKSLELQRLIEKLLRSQQTLGGVDRLKREPVDLTCLVQDVIAAHQLSAQAREIQFNLVLKPVTLIADQEKLSTIVDNLISNAIKHSPTGGMIFATLAVHRNRVVFDIRDHGTGVPEADRERIFDWFFQSEDKALAGVGGSGLGLPIARELAHAHQGSLELLPAVPDQPGAHFRLSLPMSRLREV